MPDFDKALPLKAEVKALRSLRLKQEIKNYHIKNKMLLMRIQFIYDCRRAFHHLIMHFDFETS